VVRRDERGAGEDESAHGRERATQGDEHALEAGEDAFAADAVFADDDGGGFAEPEGGAFGGRGGFEELLEGAAPAVPVRAGADEKTVGGGEFGQEGGEVVGVGVCERERGDVGDGLEVSAGFGEERGGVAGVAVERCVQDEEARAAGGGGHGLCWLREYDETSQVGARGVLRDDRCPGELRGRGG